MGVTDLSRSIAIDRPLLYAARRDGPPPIEQAFHCRSLFIENFPVTRQVGYALNRLYACFAQFGNNRSKAKKFPATRRLLC